MKLGVHLNNNSRFTILDPMAEISFDNCEIPEYMSDVRIADLTAGELSFECDVNLDIAKTMLGLDLANSGMSCSMELSQPYQVQKRRHRKKRINKKWAKRYGYITEFKSVRIRDCSIVTNDYGFDVTGNGELL